MANPLRNFVDNLIAMFRVAPSEAIQLAEQTPQGRYAMLWALYNNNQLYQRKGPDWPEAMRPLRTSVNRSVEFYVAKAFPAQGLTIEAERPDVVSAIERVAAWSNMPAKKPFWLRQMSLLGDLFIKVHRSPAKIYAEEIDPAHVSDFEVDNRGYIVDIRIDVPLDGGDWYTERWAKSYWQVWERHQQGAGSLEDIDQLGAPSSEHMTAELGIDFVPIVHAKFRDVGELRGHGCVDHVVDKIDEANRKATRLAQMLFRYNKNTWAATTGALSASDIPPAPPLNEADLRDQMDGDGIVALPYGDIKSLVPQLQYQAALDIVNADIEEIERDCPELRYYSLSQGATQSISGAAVTKLLSAALDRAQEAGDNYRQAIVRVNEIALTMGQYAGLLDVRGDYARGDWQHDIITDTAFTEDISERANTLSTLVAAGVELTEAMRLAGIERTVNGVVERQFGVSVRLEPAVVVEP